MNATQTTGWIALTTACLTVGLMVFGGWVRISGSGLGCPDWPLCHGDIIPSFETSTAIEFGHRVFAGVTILMVAVLTRISFKEREIRPFTYHVSLGAFGIIIIQAIVGGITVLTELNQFIVVIHLALAMTTLLLLALATLSVFKPNGNRIISVGQSTGLLSLGFILLILGGTLAATGYTAACMELICGNQVTILPKFIHMTHRMLALLILVSLVTISVLIHKPGQRDKYRAALVHSCTFLLFISIMLGLLNIWYTFPQILRLLHLGFAVLFWWGMSSLWASVILTKRR
jgi:heme A synthase